MMMLAVITEFEVVAALFVAAALIIGIFYVNQKSAPTTIKAKEERPKIPVQCRVAGGPDHGDKFEVEFPPELADVMGWLKSFTKFGMLESEVLFKMDPEPTLIITRKPVEFLKHDHKQRHDALEELGQ